MSHLPITDRIVSGVVCLRVKADDDTEGFMVVSSSAGYLRVGIDGDGGGGIQLYDDLVAAQAATNPVLTIPFGAITSASNRVVRSPDSRIRKGKIVVWATVDGRRGAERFTLKLGLADYHQLVTFLAAYFPISQRVV